MLLERFAQFVLSSSNKFNPAMVNVWPVETVPVTLVIVGVVAEAMAGNRQIMNMRSFLTALRSP
jgi:hypothetical protein